MRFAPTRRRPVDSPGAKGSSSETSVAEQIWTAEGQRTAPRRVASLSSAESWLAPALSEPLRTSSAPDLDWWPALRIELLNLARRWLDANQTLAEAGMGATVVTARPHFWKAIADRHVADVQAPLASRLTQLRSAPGRNIVLKETGFDLHVRRMASRFVPVRPPSERVGTAFLCEVPTPSMSQALLATATSGDVVIAADPRCQRAAYDAGLAVVSLWSGNRAQPTPIRRIDAAATLRTRLSSVDPAFAAVAAMPTARLWTNLMQHRECLRGHLAGLQPSAVAVASDQHRYGVLAVGVARELGIPSVVFQHGIIADPAGFFPPRADWFLTIDDASSQRYIDTGVRRERVVAVGRPHAARELDVPRVPHHLLVPLQPIHTQVADELLDLVSRLVVPVVLRLHPGDAMAHSLGDDELLSRLGWRGAGEVAIDRTPTPDDVLGTTALVVAHDSTFALDAAQRRVPVAIYSPRHAASPLEHALPAFDDLEGLGLRWTSAQGAGAMAGTPGLVSGEEAVSAARSALQSLQ